MATAKKTGKVPKKMAIVKKAAPARAGGKKTAAKKVAGKKTVAKKTTAKAMATKNYPALSFKQRGAGGPRCVLFQAPVSEILQWADIGALGPKSVGAQREKKEARVVAIRKFMEANPANTIPTALIVAFNNGRSTFTEAAAGVGQLQVKGGTTKAATIVDGQHRLYGINEFDPKTPVAVVGLVDTNEVETAFQFLVINNKSSRVAATHTKALLASMTSTALASRLKSAKLAFDAEGIRDIDLINSDTDSPFYQSIDWTTTPPEKRMVQATAIELSLDYLSGLGISEFDDRDVRRSVFLVIWKTIKSEWSTIWVKDSRLISKVGIVVLTRFIADLITNWADSDDLDIEVTDLEQIQEQTTKIIGHMDKRFWTTPWAEKAQGGFDTNQGRDRVLAAIVQMYRNGRKEIPWYTDIDIIDRAASSA